MHERYAAIGDLANLKGTTPQQLLYEQTVLQGLVEQHILISFPQPLPPGPATVIVQTAAGSSVALAIDADQFLSIQASPIEQPSLVKNRTLVVGCPAEVRSVPWPRLAQSLKSVGSAPDQVCGAIVAAQVMATCDSTSRFLPRLTS